MKIRTIVLSLLSVMGLSACGGGSGSTLGSTTTTGTGTNNNLMIGGVSTTTGTSSTTGSVGSSTSTIGISNIGIDTNPATSANGVLSVEGLWRGSSDTSRTVTTLILDNSFYWMLYSPAGNSTGIAGVVVGNSLSSNGKLTSSNGKDFNFETGSLFPLTWVGSYTAQSRLQGSLTYTDIPGGIVGLNATYDNAYNLTPSLADISGRYTGSSTSLANGSVDTAFILYATGQISGSRTDGCTFTGSISPRVRGNAYSVSLDYGVNCRERNSGRSANSKGSAYINPVNKQLFSVTLNSSIDDVLLFIGNKQ